MYRSLTFRAKLALILCYLHCPLLMADADNTVSQRVEFDLLIRIEFILDYSMKVVWPHLLDTRAWITEFPIKVIDGERGEEGEIIQIAIMSEEEVIDKYFAKRIKVIPNHQIIWKYLPHMKPASAMFTLNGYDVYELREINGKTHVSFQTFQEYSTSQISEEELSSLMETSANLGKKMWLESYIPKLKELLEKEAR